MMRRFAPIAVCAVLLVSGCAGTQAEPTATFTAEPQIDSTPDTLEDGVAAVRALSADTPNLSATMAGLAQALPDLIVAADFPFNINNAINTELITLNSDLLGDPSSAASRIGDFNLIADQIETQLKNQ